MKKEVLAIGGGRDSSPPSWRDEEGLGVDGAGEVGLVRGR